MNKFKHYAESLLENIADELNVQKVIIRVEGSEAVYRYDTVSGRGTGMTNYRIAHVIFSCDILKDMDLVRAIVKDGLKQRSDAGIKVRQPLASVTINRASSLIVL